MRETDRKDPPFGGDVWEYAGDRLRVLEVEQLAAPSELGDRYVVHVQAGRFPGTRRAGVWRVWVERAKLVQVARGNL